MTFGDVRRVRADEWQALRDLRLRALAGAPQMFGTTLAEAQRRTEADWREAARRGEQNDRWVTFVAEAKGRLIGMASGSVNEDGVVDLIQMWVNADARRRGIGRRLGEAVLAWTAERRATLVRLAVNESEPGAVALYRSLGFEDTGRREADLFEGREALAMIMEKMVTPAT
jgi:ribosomal protein S18 acetylase RimI-like enzyme